ncbi:bifunctional glutamine synthetase adenylyltransferase/deadenyltransferase [Actinobacillus succinogenes]|uniref:Bifunctional glutamine synthetase adenylyltransferase/adenylyl-removing enzyme n=1 Tax=Actinobacillus succinogenes (strain ATCC 55618 / DSM 22257 / CCUG 43843 / 130Z) TaxID=339671 RepID=A6VPF1_ACTSZ|nr:bifunctional [glutamate--ammonia ligase]-adenylyl-L-tyrosine phosphorylase/[glutamate--ammonia-ligase] adenylyltransferase [Actinobacillus succinogenes]ABR74848.1 (Glutamate--ammonia-ligase) adenylyltransferase [Actinobacillus succinogenes 130Z]PHI40741.1 bifunctional glutamine synthetase adenylyltransferase/deadenyltransferase [Actinobacillus succinogenes]
MLSLSAFEPQLNQLAATLTAQFPERFPANFAARHANTPLILQSIAMSDFVTKVWQNQPHFLAECWQTIPTLADCTQYSERLSIRLAQAETEEQLYRLLRRFRNREMTKLSMCQTLNLGSVEEIFIRLSQLAESLIIGARDWLYIRACKEMGTPTDQNGQPQQLYILGMGKLGGCELNFSSDIDLIFTYPENGETQGARRSVDNQRFFTRLGQRLINALDQFTADGFVYRTDMRLRPFGDSGALALSFAAMETYYQEQGRDWERYAMIKGRILGADEKDPNVHALRQMLRPFIYRRYIDFSVIQSLREMKGKIEREVRRRGLVDNIKLGAGGIREIEFIVQVFQLIRGGREVTLQQHALLNLLPEIEKLQLLSFQQRQDLTQAYLFLRRVENVLQAIDDKQTQLLPTEELNRQRLIAATAEFTQWDENRSAAVMRYPIHDWQSFYIVLQQQQQKVRSVFDQLIGDENETESGEENSSWVDFLEIDNDEIMSILAENHLAESDMNEVCEKLIRFKDSLAHRPIGTRGREVLTQWLPYLLTRIFAHPSYLILLPRILNIVEKIVTRTTYLELLQENPQALEQLIELCSQSQMIAEQMARHPILLDELLDRKALLNLPSFENYPAELQQYLLRLPEDDEEQYINALRQFKQTTLLRVAAADILGVLPVMKVSDHLTYLAEAIIAAVVNLAWQQITARFGVPEHLNEGEKGFLVIGYGKLGGIELGYKSDLDLVCLYDASEGYTIGGRKQIDINQFYLRLTQKIVSIFSMNTSAGILYEVDMRLRPSGEAGILCSSLKAFEHYQHNDAWTWETQALVRARAVYGETNMRREFDRIRQGVLSANRDLDKLKTDVREMREKMYLHLANTNKTLFNIKTDPGGITDIEFIAQYLVLANAPQNIDLAYWSDNVRIFDVMASNNIMSLDMAENLKDCYTVLRNRIHHLNLLGEPSVVPAAEFTEVRSFIQQLWKQLFA